MEPDYRDLSVMERLFGKPMTRLGWSALWLAAGFILLLAAVDLWRVWPRPVGAFMVAVTAGCGIASGVTSAIGIFWKHERSLVLFGTLLLGALVLLFIVGEILEPMPSR
jgi:hypothetical protein